MVSDFWAPRYIHTTYRNNCVWSLCCGVVTGGFLLRWGTYPWFCTDLCFCYSFLSKRLPREEWKLIQNEFCMLLVSDLERERREMRQWQTKSIKLRETFHLWIAVIKMMVKITEARVIQRSFATNSWTWWTLLTFTGCLHQDSTSKPPKMHCTHILNLSERTRKVLNQTTEKSSKWRA